MLTIKYLPYSQLVSLSSTDKMNKILNLLKSDTVVIMDGTLSSKDEALLIRFTMESIDEEFNGLEIGVMQDHKPLDGVSKIKNHLSHMLVGYTSGITLIGPARVISELRQNPEDLQVIFQKEYLLKNFNNVKRKKN